MLDNSENLNFSTLVIVASTIISVVIITNFFTDYNDYGPIVWLFKFIFLWPASYVVLSTILNALGVHDKFKKQDKEKEMTEYKNQTNLYEEGLNAYKNKNYSLAVSSLSKINNINIEDTKLSETFFMLGEIYKKGLLGTRDYKLAQNNYKKSFYFEKHNRTLKSYISVLDNEFKNNVKEAIIKNKPKKIEIYSERIEIDLIEMIWLKTNINYIAEILIYYYTKQKRKPQKEKGIEAFSVEVYNSLKDYDDKSLLLLLFYDLRLISVESMFIKNKQINNFFYDCFKFLNKINDIDENDLKTEFKKRYFKNPFYKVFNDIPLYKRDKTVRDILTVLRYK